MRSVIESHKQSNNNISGKVGETVFLTEDIFNFMVGPFCHETIDKNNWFCGKGSKISEVWYFVNKKLRVTKPGHVSNQF